MRQVVGKYCRTCSTINQLLISMFVKETPMVMLLPFSGLILLRNWLQLQREDNAVVVRVKRSMDFDSAGLYFVSFHDDTLLQVGEEYSFAQPS